MQLDIERSDTPTTSFPEYWYRFDDRLVSSGVDEFDEPLGPARVAIYMTKLEVIRHTPKGAWLKSGGGQRFVLNDVHKRYACATIAQAKESFIARKRKQIKIYTARIHHAEQAIAQVQRREFDL
jgi:hypothetical protein